MTNWLLGIIIVAYAVSGIVSTIAYVPTIVDLWHRKRMSANISSYVLWTLCGAVTLLYAVFVLPDTLFIIVSALGFASCAIILILGIVLVRRNRKH